MQRKKGRFTLFTTVCTNAQCNAAEKHRIRRLRQKGRKEGRKKSRSFVIVIEDQQLAGLLGDWTVSAMVIRNLVSAVPTARQPTSSRPRVSK